MGLFTFFVIGAVGGVVVYQWKVRRINLSPLEVLQKLQTLSLPPPNMLPTPTPLPLPQGKQTYFVSGKAEQGAPVLVEVVYDPFDPKPGQQQTILIKTKAKPEANTVSVLMITDSKEMKYELKNLDTQGELLVWEGSWEVTDTHINQYRAVVTAKNQKGAGKIEMVLR